MVELTYRGRKRLLWAANLAAGIGIAACVHATFVLPLDVETGAIDRAEAASTANPLENVARSVAPIEKYGVIYARHLRKPLYDPGPIKVRTEPKRLKLVLIGTAVDPGSTYGIFRDGQGKIHLAGVGQKIEDAEITSIRDGLATVRFEGREIDLKVPGEQGNQ